MDLDSPASPSAPPQAAPQCLPRQRHGPDERLWQPLPRLCELMPVRTQMMTGQCWCSFPVSLVGISGLLLSLWVRPRRCCLAAAWRCLLILTPHGGRACALPRAEWVHAGCILHPLQLCCCGWHSRRLLALPRVLRSCRRCSMGTECMNTHAEPLLGHGMGIVIMGSPVLHPGWFIRHLPDLRACHPPSRLRPVQAGARQLVSAWRSA